MPTDALIDDRVRRTLLELGFDFEVLECDPEFADTEQFTARYGYSLEQSANTILVASKRGPKKFAACVLLATTSLNVNTMVKSELGVSKASFANAEVTSEVTGMSIGGVTPFGLPREVDVLVDGAVMKCDSVILGSGNRNSKILIDPRQLVRIQGARVVEGLAS